jgi:hypothetical protein
MSAADSLEYLPCAQGSHRVSSHQYVPGWQAVHEELPVVLAT